MRQILAKISLLVVVGLAGLMLAFVLAGCGGSSGGGGGGKSQTGNTTTNGGGGY
jgi:hypothetical protein